MSDYKPILICDYLIVKKNGGQIAVARIQLTVAGALALGDGQEPFHIEVPWDNAELIEVRGRLKTAGTDFITQLREFTSADVAVGDVIKGTGLDFDADTNKSTTDLLLTTPAKLSYYKVDIDRVIGSPADLALFLYFKVTDV